jgi:hypothetical protein
MRKKAKDNPVHRIPDWRVTLPMAQACPRCGARTRSGGLCRSPAMANGRCRMHGGKSTGPRTAEGLERMRRAKTIHGLYSAETLRLMRAIRVLQRGGRSTRHSVRSTARQSLAERRALRARQSQPVLSSRRSSRPCPEEKGQLHQGWRLLLPRRVLRVDATLSTCPLSATAAYQPASLVAIYQQCFRPMSLTERTGHICQRACSPR